jgi:hypothetical protein
MTQSYPDRPVVRDAQRGAAAGTVVLVIAFMMFAFVAAITVAVYTFSPAPGT